MKNKSRGSLTGRLLIALIILLAVSWPANADATLTLPASLTRVEEEAFAGVTGFDRVEIPEGTLAIGSRAFAGCNLTEAALPASLTSIADDAFEGNPGMTATAPEGSYAYEWAEAHGFIQKPLVPSPVADFTFANLSNGTCMVTGYKGSDADVVIPSIGSTGRQVTEIDSRAFITATCLKTVVIPEGVTRIGEYAFGNCYNLTDVTIPESVTRIYGYAFNKCYKLNHVTIPGSVNAIENGAFCNCQALTDITISAGVSTIGSSAFANCYSLTEIVIPQGVSSIGTGAFSGCSSLTGVSLPAGLVSIGARAFQDCSSLTDVTFPASLTSIGENAFRRCASLASVTIPANISVINADAFAECSGLTSVVLQEGVTEIGQYAFYNCTSLSEVIIPESVTEIGESAFYNCAGLSEVIIPEGVASIQNSAFGCCGLARVSLPASLTSIADSAFNGNPDITATAPEGSYAYEWALSKGILYVDPSVALLHACTFTELSDTTCALDRYSGSDTEITIPARDGSGKTVVEIGEWAFSNCTSLTSVVIPEGVTAIDDGAFRLCSNLISVSLPESLASIGSQAFTGCGKLAGIVIPNGITDIASGTFYSCGALTSVILPEGLVSIGDQAFSGCSSLTVLTLPDSVETIGNYAFYGCSSLTGLTLSANLTGIGNNAFWYCSGLVSCAIPDGLTSLGSYAFPYDIVLYARIGTDGAISVSRAGKYFHLAEGGFKLRYLFSDGVVTDLAIFQDDADITRLVVPQGVTTIGGDAFRNCALLESVVIPEGVKSIGQFAFWNCPSLTAVSLPASLVSIDYVAFPLSDSLTMTAPADSYAYEWAVSCGFIVDSAYHASPFADFSFNPLGDGTCSVVQYNGSDADVVIPKTDGYGSSVRKISALAFNNNTSLTSVVIPEGVTTIGERAFEGCASLASVTIPDSVTTIGASAFSQCSALTGLTLPDSLADIGEYAFWRCSGLDSVIIPPNTLSIGRQAFAQCFLSEVTLPASLTFIDSTAFERNKGVRMIVQNGTYAFDWAVENLFIQAIPASPVEDFTFSPLLDDTCKLTAYLGSDTDVVIPLHDADGNLVVSVSASVFSGHQDLISVVFPTTVTAIPAGAFSGCASLERVELPASMSSFGEGVFADCPSLQSIILDNGNTKYISIDGVLYDLETGWLVAFPGGWTESYYMPQGTVGIPANAFRNYASLTDLHIPDSVTYVGENAFENCGGIVYCALGSAAAERISRDGGSFRVFGEDYSLKYLFFSGSNTRGVEMLNGEKDIASLVIPDYVTRISAGAFEGCQNLTSIDIPAGVTFVGERAFADCASLTHVTIHNDCSYKTVFDGCSDLTVEFAEGATSVVGWTFDGCDGLTSVTFSTAVNSIGYAAFRNCASLAEIALPASLESIDAYAFYGCASLSSLVIPDGVTVIGNSAFSGCASLSAVSLPASLTDISEGLFGNCASLMSVVIPDGVAGVGRWAFENCAALTSVDMRGGASIGVRAFKDCANLASLTLPNGLSSIDSWAFDNCTSLASVVIPDGVSEVQLRAFEGCDTLFYASLNSSAARALSASNYHFRVPGDCYNLFYVDEYYYSAHTDELMLCEVDQDATELFIPDYVTDVGANACSGCADLASVTIEDGVVNISEYAFKNCVSLTEITIPASVRWVGPAFQNCTNLTNVTFLGDTECGKGAFAGCVSLTHATFGPDVVHIRDMFSDCVSLTGVTISNGVEFIDNGAFDHCGLTEVTIPASVSRVGVSFTNCRSLARVTIQGDTTIFHGAFAGDVNLTYATFSQGVTKVCSNAFSGCASLTSVSLPSSLTEIGSSAFKDCVGLTGVSLPGGLTRIGAYAFSGCVNLTGISLPNGIQYIEDGAFWNCDVLTGVSYLLDENYDFNTNNHLYRFNDLGFAVFYCNGEVYGPIPSGVKHVGLWAFGKDDSSGGSGEGPDDHEHEYSYYCDDDLILHQYCLICEPRTAEQIQKDTENLQRYILTQRAHGYAISLDDPASLLLASIAAKNDEALMQVTAYAYKLATFDFSGVVRKFISGSTEVNKLRRKAIQKAVSLVLTTRTPSYAEQDHNLTFYDIVLLSTLLDETNAILNDEERQEINTYIALGHNVRSCIEKIAQVSGVPVDVLKHKKIEEYYHLPDVSTIKQIAIQFEEEFESLDQFDLYMFLLDTGFDLKEYFEMSMERKLLFNACMDDAVFVIGFLKYVKNAYADDAIIRDFCDEAISQLKSEVINWGVLKDVVSIIGTNGASALVDFAAGGGIVGVLSKASAATLTIGAKAGGLLTEFVMHTDTTIESLEDVKILYEVIEQTVLNYKTNIEVSDYYLQDVRLVHEAYILMLKASGLKLAGEIVTWDNGIQPLSSYTDSMIDSYQQAMDNLVSLTING